ncbi:MAG: TetR/AcrR family transcriptional regulator [Pseudomonadota bacterium]
MKNAGVKQSIYESAMRLFLAKGFDETTVEEIAAQAGFSRATFFNHFGSKAAVLRHRGLEMADVVQSVIENAGPSTGPVELIRAVIEVLADYTEKHREEIRLVYTYSLREPDYPFDPSSARKRVWELLTALVAKAQDRGEIRTDMAPGELAHHILFLHLGVVISILNGLGDAETLIGSAWQFILGGITGGYSRTG